MDHLAGDFIDNNPHIDRVHFQQHRQDRAWDHSISRSVQPVHAIIHQFLHFNRSSCNEPFDYYHHDCGYIIMGFKNSDPIQVLQERTSAIIKSTTAEVLENGP